MTRKLYIYILTALTLLATGCNDMRDIPHEPNWDGTAANARILVLSEGLFNMNNSTLALYSPADKSLDYNIFKSVNNRGLGDTANDMQRNGDKIWIVVNISSRVEIIDANSFKSVGEIPLFNENGVARQPRHVAFHSDKAYVSCFDGYVAEIDTATLEILRWVECGRNPDNIVIARNKLYVSNSGGLDNPYYDNSVSVVDLTSFKQIKRIEVGTNPGSIAADSEGDVYVVSRGDYNDEEYMLHKIDSEIDEVITTFTDINPLNLVIYDDIAYMYSYDYRTKLHWIKTFNCLTDKVISDNFVTDGTEIETPFGINLDRRNGDIYICESYNHVIWGDVLCFSHNGKLKYRINEIGLNPNCVMVLE